MVLGYRVGKRPGGLWPTHAGGLNKGGYQTLTLPGVFVTGDGCAPLPQRFILFVHPTRQNGLPHQEAALEITPIGHFVCAEDAPALAPRQGALVPGRIGQVQLLPHLDPLCLRDLEGFERIWLLFHFDRAVHWKPLVLPPHEKTRRGVFATRSPYRPNPIGLTAVTLEKISGHTLHVTGGDLLNGTPILDIKPYLPFADAFPGAKAGWVDERDRENAPFEVRFSSEAKERLDFLENLTGKNLFQLVADQLGRAPTLGKAKRIKPAGGGHWVFSWRLWRIGFHIEGQVVHVISVEGGQDGWGDPHAPPSENFDTEAHRKFRERFSQP